MLLPVYLAHRPGTLLKVVGRCRYTVRCVKKRASYEATEIKPFNSSTFASSAVAEHRSTNHGEAEAKAEDSKVEGEDGTWACSACTYINEGHDSACSMCEGSRDSGGKRRSEPSISAQPKRKKARCGGMRIGDAASQ